MSKKLLVALIILGLVAVVLVLNTSRLSNVDVKLIFFTVHAMKSLVFLSFIVTGVVIGLLLK